jgi:hypothetical protein
MENDENGLDGLEEFVSSHRNEFDDEAPSSGVWENLASEVASQKAAQPKLIPLRKAVVYGAAAVAVVAFGLFYLLKEKQSAVVAEVPEVAIEIDGYQLSDISPELAEVEGYYVTRVNQNLQRLNDLNVDPMLLEEIDFLDEEFNQLKSEMGESVNNDQIIEAMIDNYRLKLEILEAMLIELENTEEDEMDITFM